ncbi:MAG: HaeIII family restriction endonuclease [Oscillospiraceae bacterium]|jgi:hypothetical protein|nr:HaeIII family restriction endonuclease [Oscillospiraceae bacterium]
MSTLSNDQGRAFEFACLMCLEREISKLRAVSVVHNSSFHAALRAWETMTDRLKEWLNASAYAGVATIFELEPLIAEDGNDLLELKIQTDQEGKVGDVRDLLIIRRSIQWEIGLSIKHNHEAVKHSRLAKNLDFGEKWFGIPCSRQYWDDVAPVFGYLDEAKCAGAKWRDLPAKEKDVYIPLLTAFLDEIRRSYETHGSVMAERMVEYLLGRYDFYKVIGKDGKRAALVETFNFRGSLNQSGFHTQPMRKIPTSNLPTRIAAAEFRPGFNNTVEIYLDAGWEFSFRIHNASTYVETSLKFDVQIIGMPATITTIQCGWN